MCRDAERRAKSLMGSPPVSSLPVEVRGDRLLPGVNSRTSWQHRSHLHRSRKKIKNQVSILCWELAADVCIELCESRC